MTDLGWIIFGCTIIALAAIEVARACRAKRLPGKSLAEVAAECDPEQLSRARREWDDLKSDQWGC